MILLWMIMGLTFNSPARAVVEPSEEFFGSVSLVNNDVYHLFWKSDDSSIIFEVHAKVKGWVGFGLSPNGGMAKSDIVIGWVKDGFSYFTDRYAAQESIMPTIDASQDWTLLSAEETSTHTRLKFKRPLYTCDPEDHQVKAETMRVIFAYSNDDPTTEDAVMYHNGNRGTKSILFIASHDKPLQMPADAFYKDFLNNNVTIPHDSDTTYWCMGFNAPKMTEKHHLFRVEPIVQPGNEALVHHIVMYACYHRPDGLEQIDEPQGAPCNGPPNLPWKKCFVLIAAWGVGGTTFNFPESAGYPFGEAKGILFLRLNTHYDNPQFKQGIVDASGLRFWFTKSLRQYDAGAFGTGMSVSSTGHILPAGYPSLTSFGQCTKECLTKAMGSAPAIHVFAIFLHTHLLGRGIRVHHYRNGVEKSYISSDLAYDFNYQETRPITPDIEIQKGDNLVVECIYDTEDQKNVTFGGLGTSQEMCLAFLYYYPKIDLVYCTSIPTQANMAEHLALQYEGGEGTTKAKISEGPYRNKTLNQFFQAIGKFPDKKMMDKYQEAIKTGEFVQRCLQESERTTTLMQAPKVTSPYQEEVVQCSDALPKQPWMMLMMICCCGLLLTLAIK